MFRVVRKLHKVLPILVGAFFAALPLLANGSAVASENVTTNVTVEPSLTVTIPSTPITLNLNPASTTSGNNNITITVGTNNATGYKTVMTSRSGGTDLVDATDSSLVIPTLDTGTSYASLSAFPANHWGYKQDSGNYQPFTTNTTIMQNSTYANVDSTTLNFATKIDYLQEAGAYSTTLVFDTVVNPGIGYMQDLALGQCTTTPQLVVDKRDGREYYIQKLNDGNCWMLQNLRIGQNTDTIALTAADSDVSSGGFTLNGKLSDGKFTYSTVSGAAMQNNSSQYYCTDDYGCYYNWYTATAGSGTTSVSSGNTNYSICPKGWSLPTRAQYVTLSAAYGNSATNLLVSPTTLKENTNGASAPGLLLGGNYYYGGANAIGTTGRYWDSTASSAEQGGVLDISTSSVSPSTSNYKYIGFAARCVMKPQTMQSFTDANADAMAMNETRTLMDARDGKLYTVAKLADGNVWMTSNLNLAGGTVLSSDLSDVPTANYYTLPASHTPTSSDFSSDTAAYVYNTGTETTSQSDCTSSKPCNSYYSWLAATAGGKDASGNVVTTDGADVAYSICPKGWRLPKSGNSSDTSSTSATGYKKGDFYKLATAYGANLETQQYETSATFYNNAGAGTLPNFIQPGRYTDGALVYGGQFAYYWSSSVKNSTLAYYFDFGSTSVYSAENKSYRNGFNVRCVKNDTRNIAAIKDMQDINAQVVANTAEGTSTTMVDERDGQKYTVAKINGKVWMTKNLAIGCNGVSSSYGSTITPITLTNTDSNISAATWTTPVNSLTLGDDYTDLRMECSSTYGAWYNYAAGTAGTITGSSNSTESTYDVCPKGWRIPSYAETTALASAIGSSPSIFSPSIGGHYFGGSIIYDSWGFWWTSSASATTIRSALYFLDGALGHTGAYRTAGMYIRCIAK